MLVCLGNPYYAGSNPAALARAGRSGLWRVTEDARLDDAVALYAMRPESAIIAIGRLVAKPKKRGARGPLVASVGRIKLLGSPVSIATIRRLFPGWRYWLRPSQPATVPDNYRGRFMTLLRSAGPKRAGKSAFPRRRLSVEALLEAIGKSSSGKAARAARNLIEAAGNAGLTPVGRRESVSLRLPLPGRAAEKWLTLLVVSTAGTVFVNWLDRWNRIPGGKAIAGAYERNLCNALGVRRVKFHPTAYLNAVRLDARFVRLERLVVRTAALLRKRLPRVVTAKSQGQTGRMVYEGIVTEGRYFRKGRSRALRAEALSDAAGRCAVCGRNYGVVLRGDGMRVLQVHHKQQLASLDAPKLNTADDLAVVCSNCHQLIHLDPKTALSVAALRHMLRRDGHYALA